MPHKGVQVFANFRNKVTAAVLTILRMRMDQVSVPSEIPGELITTRFGEQGMIAGTIQEGVNVPPATLSFHLKELTNSGLVTVQRVARNYIYRAAHVEMDSLLGYLTANYCQGAECAVESETATADCRW